MDEVPSTSTMQDMFLVINNPSGHELAVHPSEIPGTIYIQIKAKMKADGTIESAQHLNLLNNGSQMIPVNLSVPQVQLETVNTVSIKEKIYTESDKIDHVALAQSLSKVTKHIQQLEDDNIKHKADYESFKGKAEKQIHHLQEDNLKFKANSEGKVKAANQIQLMEAYVELFKEKLPQVLLTLSDPQVNSADDTGLETLDALQQQQDIGNQVQAEEDGRALVVQQESGNGELERPTGHMNLVTTPMSAVRHANSVDATVSKSEYSTLQQQRNVGNDLRMSHLIEIVNESENAESENAESENAEREQQIHGNIRRGQLPGMKESHQVRNQVQAEDGHGLVQQGSFGEMRISTGANENPVAQAEEFQPSTMLKHVTPVVDGARFTSEQSTEFNISNTSPVFSDVNYLNLNRGAFNNSQSNDHIISPDQFELNMGNITFAPVERFEDELFPGLDLNRSPVLVEDISIRQELRNYTNSAVTTTLRNPNPFHSSCVPRDDEEVRNLTNSAATTTRRKANPFNKKVCSLLSKQFKDEELACGGMTSGKRKYKDNEINYVALDKRRLSIVREGVRNAFPKEFDERRFSGCVTEKCRNMRRPTSKKKNVHHSFSVTPT